MNNDRQIMQAAAEAKLAGGDHQALLARIQDPARRKTAEQVVEASTAVAIWHADKIAKMDTIQARREAIEKLPTKLAPAVKKRLAALWEARKA